MAKKSNSNGYGNSHISNTLWRETLSPKELRAVEARKAMGHTQSEIRCHIDIGKLVFVTTDAGEKRLVDPVEHETVSRISLASIGQALAGWAVIGIIVASVL